MLSHIVLHKNDRIHNFYFHTIEFGNERVKQLSAIASCSKTATAITQFVRHFFAVDALITVIVKWCRTISVNVKMVLCSAMVLFRLQLPILAVVHQFCVISLYFTCFCNCMHVTIINQPNVNIIFLFHLELYRISAPANPKSDHFPEIGPSLAPAIFQP